MTVVRARIDARTGLVELEGDKEFVSAYLDKLLPLIETTGFGVNFRNGNGSPEENEEVASAEQVTSDKEAAARQKKKRRVPKRPPAGASCRERILTLRNDGFFSEHRSATDIVAGLAKKGWTYKSNQVGAALVVMFSKGEIQRTKTDDGHGFVYYWDRQ